MADGAQHSEAIDEFVLLPYQSAWVFDRSPIKVCEKGRQEGYTWATACEAVQVASTRREDGGCHVWFMITSQQDAREFIDECARWVEHLAPAIHACPEVESYDWIDEQDPGMRSGGPEDEKSLAGRGAAAVNGYQEPPETGEERMRAPEL